jgi:plastocyanin
MFVTTKAVVPILTKSMMPATNIRLLNALKMFSRISAKYLKFRIVYYDVPMTKLIMSGADFGCLLAVFAMLSIWLSVSPVVQHPLYATENLAGVGQPNIAASNVFDTHSMVLGDNIRDLVILIPNEAHESTNQPKDQYPLANQPYLPQNAVINRGTTVTWFNGDVDHDHKVTLSSDESTTNSGSESGDFAYNTASRPITYNNSGVYNFVETDVNDNDPSFVMNGTIEVSNQVSPLTLSNATMGTSSPDTVGTLMVPAKDLNQYVSTLTSKGLTVDSTYTFKDLRGGQKGTGPEQAYVVWTSSGMNLDQVISALKEITPSLPYS